MFLKPATLRISRRLRRLAAATFMSGAAVMPALAESPKDDPIGRLIERTATDSERQTYFSFGRQIGAPTGYIDFCKREMQECVGDVSVGTRQYIEMNPHRWNVLQSVNRHYNKTIRPVTDLELYNREEHWTIPRGPDAAGDCEDYLLAKRDALLRAGWPRSALLVTVVTDARNDGHAVLTVVTNQGMYVLDNAREDIRLWSDTGYRFRFTQNPVRPVEWVEIVTTPAPATGFTGLSLSLTAPVAQNVLTGWVPARPNGNPLRMRNTAR